MAQIQRGVIVQPAKVTLRGFRLAQESPDRADGNAILYPWTRVEKGLTTQEASWWDVYDQDGERLREGGKRLRLELQGKRATHAARRAQVRSFEQMWKRGDLSVSQVSKWNWRTDWLAPGIFLPALGAGTHVLVTHLLDLPRKIQVAPASTEYEVAFGLVLLFVVLSMLFVSGILLYAWYQAFKVRNRARVRLDSRGVHQLMRNRNESFSPWSELVELRYVFGALPCLRFQDGTEVWLPQASKRLALVLAVIRENLGPQVFRRLPSRRHRILCVVTITAISTTLTAVVANFLSHDSYGLGLSYEVFVWLVVFGVFFMLITVIYTAWSSLLRFPGKWRSKSKR